MTGAENQNGGAGAAPFALETRGVSKSFGAVKANKNIDLQIRPAQFTA